MELTRQKVALDGLGLAVLTLSKSGLAPQVQPTPMNVQPSI